MTRGLLAVCALLLFVPVAEAQDLDAGVDGGFDAGVPAAPETRPDAGELATVELDADMPEAGPLDGAIEDAGMPDAGEPDAGEPDAGEPDAGPAMQAAEERTLADRLYGLLFERAERAEEAARRANDRAAEPTPVTVNTPPAPDNMNVRVVGCDAGPSLWGLLPERAVPTGELVLLLLLAGFFWWLLGRMRKPLPERGLLPRLLGAVHLFARVSAVALSLLIATRLLPGWLRPALLLTVAAAAIAVGVGIVWVVLPDVVSGILLLTEERVRRGLWISGDGFEGTVERVGPRVTILHDAEGHRLTVPNRQLVRSAIHAIDRRWPELHLSLRVPTDRPAKQVRRAVEDAVLCSPHLPPDPELSVARDAEDPQVWRIRVRLLEVTHREAFEGQLLERIEEALEASATAIES